jgi:DNA mismatch repair ATPase MutL
LSFSLSPQENKIRVLPAPVVNQIAAGEVIQSPVHAIKELLENSLDAGSTEIRVNVDFVSSSIATASTATLSSTATTTGAFGLPAKSELSRFVVVDNGCGIARDDLELAATRHATSKFRHENDFHCLETFGFRGEALASLSYVGRLAITTRTKDSAVAFEQHYKDGSPVAWPLAPISSSTSTASSSSTSTLNVPRPCARRVGTTVTVEDLFGHLPARHRATLLHRPSDEYAKIVQLVQRFAVHSASKGVGFVCERTRRTTNHTQSGKNRAHPDEPKAMSSGVALVDVNTCCLPSLQTLRGDPSREGPLLRQRRIEATRDAVVHVFGGAGSAVVNPSQLRCFETVLTVKEEGAGGNNEGEDGPEDTAVTIDGASDAPSSLIYSCRGFIALPWLDGATGSQLDPRQQNSRGGRSRGSVGSSASSVGSSHFILFVNDRLVECTPLKRAVEVAYRASSSSFHGGSRNSSKSHGTSSSKPAFCYLSVRVPGRNVDVNVHPSKQHVALLHLDRICDHLRSHLASFLSDQGQQFQFKDHPVPSVEQQEQQRHEFDPLSVPSASLSSKSDSGTTLRSSHNDTSKKRKMADAGLASSSESNDGQAQIDQENEDQPRLPPPPPGKKTATSITVPPSKMVRAQRSSQVGALEPFLVPAQPSASQRIVYAQTSMRASSSSSSASSYLSAAASAGGAENESPNGVPFSKELVHNPSCPLAASSSSSSSALESQSIDMTQPGAFAKLAALCDCRRKQQVQQQQNTLAAESSDATVIRLVRSAIVRPRRVAPTECRYTSVLQLRDRIRKRTSQVLLGKLRSSVFVGTLSAHRSLLQCGDELVEVHHTDLATQLFYQLALWRFAGAKQARLGHPLDVAEMVGSVVQLEDSLIVTKLDDDLSDQSSTTTESDAEGPSTGLVPSGTNERLARQVASCLLQHSEMLAEYFSISIEEQDGKTVLSGLPILLDGYVPSPHATPLFLLRLATEVDWTEERPCFHGICRELGSFYAAGTTGCAAGVESGPYLDVPQDVISHRVRHTIFPAVSSLLIPTTEMESDASTFRIVTSVSRLYKEFERGT